MKRKQTQTTLFQCFHIPAPDATAVTETNTKREPDEPDSIVPGGTENEPDDIVMLPGKWKSFKLCWRYCNSRWLLIYWILSRTS